MATAEKKHSTAVATSLRSATEIDASEICATLCLHGLHWVSFGSKSSSKPSVVRLGHGEALEKPGGNVNNKHVWQLRFFGDFKMAAFESKAFILLSLRNIREYVSDRII